MTRFVTIKLIDGQQRLVNPDRVTQLAEAVGGSRTRIIFGALQGGFDELVTNAPIDLVRGLLEATDERPDPLMRAMRRNALPAALATIYGPPVPLKRR